MNGGQPVRIADVASVADTADLATSYVWHGVPAGRAGPATGQAPAVTLAIAKKPGSNAADVTTAVTARLVQLQGELIPDGVHAEVTRDYGQTATDKAQKLIQKLAFATLSVVLLMLFTLGWREALVVGAAVVLTLALTLFASRMMGFTLNRVSLFALIFSIGILVDDAIVVVENIHRHMQRGAASLRAAIPAAVDEVGGPTILATFTVIAALLPMAFVTGLMGPYMRPIPINASAGMLLSLIIALVVTPWLSLKLLSRHHVSPAAQGGPTRLHRLFSRLLLPFLDERSGSKRRRLLFASMLLGVVLAAGLAVVKLVVLKMLPFDNKSEVQVVVDLAEGRTLEDTNALLTEIAQVVAVVPEVQSFQAYAGTSAPMNFNGLVRQYFLRSGSNVGDLQVNLVDKHERDRQSHDIARELRPQLAAIGERHGASVKVVEVPPGPPVLAPIVAEIYGPDYAASRRIGQALLHRMRATEGIVDTDSSIEAQASHETLRIDRIRAARLGVDDASVVTALTTALAGSNATWLHDGASRNPVPVRLRLSAADQARLDAVLQLKVRSRTGALVPLSEVVQVERGAWEGAIHHKDLMPVVYVTADEAGWSDSPLYGMFDLVGQVSDNDVGGERLAQHFIGQPQDTASHAIKWDGEWQITYETFRDMGIAYAAGIVLIYLLVVAQFRSYLVPLIIMAPIPLTIIGVMPGHALLGAQFTATSMIGMIALAGIIVRNSILLVDFINQSVAEGRALRDAVVEACAVRAKPIVLTGVAAMLGGFFILDDPIFNGLAVSLIFGHPGQHGADAGGHPAALLLLPAAADRVALHRMPVPGAGGWPVVYDSRHEPQPVAFPGPGGPLRLRPRSPGLRIAQPRARAAAVAPLGAQLRRTPAAGRHARIAGRGGPVGLQFLEPTVLERRGRRGSRAPSPTGGAFRAPGAHPPGAAVPRLAGGSGAAGAPGGAAWRRGRRARIPRISDPRRDRCHARGAERRAGARIAGSGKRLYRRHPQ